MIPKEEDVMYNIEEYVLTYEYTCVFDLEGMPHMESSYGKNEIELKVGQFLNLPFYEDKKSFIKNIELQDELFVVTLSIPCKPLWENDGEEVTLKLGEEIKYYYGRTTLNAQTDYYFKFRIIKKN
jgi:hypothetical protein